MAFRPPRLVHKVEPEYTEAARGAKVEGRVMLSVEVDPDGLAHHLRIEQSLDPGLDEKAKEAVRQWRFAPATKDGEPVAVRATIEINFRLY